MTQKRLIDYCSNVQKDFRCSDCVYQKECSVFVNNTGAIPYQGMIYDPELYVEKEIE